MVSSSIAVIAVGDFDGLENLSYLHLGQNDLTDLPDDVFDGLSALEFLYLWSNALTALPAGVFDDLMSLRQLDLSGNSLSSLPAGVFDGLSALEFLSLRDNDLTVLPEDVFGGLSALEWLTLGSNPLASLPVDVFEGLVSLQSLDIDYIRRLSLPASVFEGLVSLRHLSLIGNSLSSLPADVFDGLSALQSLWLDNNALTSLPADIFDGLSALQRLGLHYNALTSLPAGVFDGLSALQGLWLYNNALTSLSTDIFASLTVLETLHLYRNDLTCLPIIPGSVTDLSLPGGRQRSDYDTCRAGLMLSPTELGVPESDEAQYTLRLATPPLAAVTVSVSAAASGDDDITVAPAAVTFAPADWNRPQVLTLRAAEDADNLRGRRQIAHTATSSDAAYAGVSATLSAFEIDDEAPEVQLTLNPEQIAENGGISRVLAELAGGTSTADTIVVVDIASDVGGQARAAVAAAVAAGAPPPSIAAASDFTLSANRRLTIPAGRVRSVGEVTIQARDNAMPTPGGALGQVVATASNNSTVSVNQPQTQLLRVIDDEGGDGKALLTLPGRLEVSEGGSGVYRVFLASDPNGPVTVTTDAPSDAGISITPSPQALTFQSSNWSVHQSVTVTLGDNAIVDAGTRVFSIRHDVAGYGDVTTSTPVAVAVTDNDTAGFLFEPPQVSMAAGTSSTYAVSLDTRPRFDVAVDIGISALDPASSIVLGSTTRLVFTTTNWNQLQTVSLRDDRGSGLLPSPVRVLHRANSVDVDYNGLIGTLHAGGPPTFGSASVDDQRYTQGRQITALVLPQARFGAGEIAYTLTPALPAGLTIDETARTLSGTPRIAQASTEYTWRATDAAGASASLIFRIAVASDSGGGGGGGGGGGTDVLRFADASVPAQSYAVGRAITPLILPAAVGGEAPVRYSLLSVPAGLVFDAQTRTLSGTPTEVRTQRSHVYRATDATGAVATLRFSIAIAENNRPSFGDASVAAQAFTVGRTVSLTLPAATGGDGALSYALSPALPAGIAFDPASRGIAGMPTAVLRKMDFTLSATDRDGDTAELTFAIEVVEAPDDVADDSDETPRPFLRGWRRALMSILGEQSGQVVETEETE